ncbi:unnamed protein product [Anisakis simplex]|uniref:Flagellar biosynthesis protein FlgE n=1 Tax=Anisakis simplex TaxID=6269 RepID=A0A0M3K280_ANISI|nr:unnamed protein product [Anisakis simplex]
MSSLVDETHGSVYCNSDLQVVDSQLRSNETFEADLRKSAELITANSTTFSESIIVAKDQVVLDYFNKTRNAAVHVIDESQVNASQIADSIVDTIR